MIPQALRITLCVGVICYFIIILHYLKRKMLELRYTLIWLLAGAVMAVLVVYPELLYLFRTKLGIADNMNALFILVFAFCIMMLMILTAIVSRNAMKMRIMIQEMAMLEKRIRELEQENTDMKKDKATKNE